METFSVLLALCAGNSRVIGKFPSQRPVRRSFDLLLNKRLSKQSRVWWFQTPSCSLWRDCNINCDGGHSYGALNILRKYVNIQAAIRSMQRKISVALTIHMRFDGKRAYLYKICWYLCTNPRFINVALSMCKVGNSSHSSPNPFEYVSLHLLSKYHRL